MTDRIAVLGAGQMGNGIAHVFAQAGYPVAMIDISKAAAAKGRETIAKNLDRQIKKGALQSADKDAILARITDHAGLDAVAGASLVIEAVTENRELKAKIFAELDAKADAGAILATNTSSISITEIAGRTKRPDAVIGMHFMNPVPVMQLVEIIRGLATSDATAARVVDLTIAVGKTPVQAARLPRVHRQSDPDADDQRGGVLPHGRRRHRRGDRHGDEARHEPPHGAAHAGRLHRARHLPGDS